jgi:N-acetylglutamate synthase-like GNAT family acetyltransferase
MIRRATEEDLPEIQRLQRAAFREEAEYVRDTEIKPMTETVEGMKEELRTSLILIYVEDGRIVGSVRARMEGDTCHINRLVVLPNHWSKGIGSALMREVESRFPDAKAFELFTRADHPRTRPFYAKHGYLPFKTEKATDTLTFVYLRKSRQV